MASIHVLIGCAFLALLLARMNTFGPGPLPMTTHVPPPTLVLLSTGTPGGSAPPLDTQFNRQETCATVSLLHICPLLSDSARDTTIMFASPSGLVPGALPFQYQPGLEYQSGFPEMATAACYSSEEPVNPALPRGSVCIIIGNNRTKKALVGQRAIVRRAVGLGGWHHCVLEADGSEVKLQVRLSEADRREHQRNWGLHAGGGQAVACAAESGARVSQLAIVALLTAAHPAALLLPCNAQRNALHVLEYGPVVAAAEAADPSGSSSDTEARGPQIGE